MRGLKDKVAIVTGGGQGIGRGIALRLAEEGCKVAIFDMNLDAAAETEALAGGATVKSYKVDVTGYDGVKAAVEAVEANLGPIWALVNNAGWDLPKNFLQTDRPLWDKIIAINLYGPLNTHHVVAPLMVARSGGRLINIASDTARVGTSTEAVYSACKGGVIAFTKSVARELTRHNVLLNIVCPGPTNTPMMAGVLGEGEAAIKWKDAMVRGLPIDEFQSIIRDTSKPVIARVNGFAIGGGNVFATLCDLTIAADTAKFGKVGPKVGSVDGGWGTALLARIVGDKKAREMWFLNEHYTAQQAMEMGLVNKVVPAAELDDTVNGWTQTLGERSPTALALAKRSFNADSDNIRGISMLSLNAVKLYYDSEKSKEGMRAFHEKRVPAV